MVFFLREKVTVLLGQVRECLELLNKLRHAIARKHESYDAVCGRVQEAASPKQTVQFLMWINKHADTLAKYIPGFTRSQHYVPNHQFVEKHLRKSSSSKSLNGMGKSASNSTLMSLGQGSS
ncbi:hypothetical protein EON65_33430 [archaeon]|nr:MAG: hypothetical protein EON65_33430 [archaeon]